MSASNLAVPWVRMVPVNEGHPLQQPSMESTKTTGLPSATARLHDLFSVGELSLETFSDSWRWS